MLLISRGLRDRGHYNVIVTPPGSDLAVRAGEEGLLVEPLRMRGQWDLQAVFRLDRILKRHRIELINSHKPNPHTLALLVRLWRRKLRLVATRHVTFPLRRHFFRSFKWSAGLDGIIAVADSVKASLIASGVPVTKIETIYSAVDFERFSPRPPDSDLRKELGLDPDHFVIGMVGDYRHWKGYPVFIDAAARVLARYPQARFLAVGSPSDAYRDMLNRIDLLGLTDRFILTGFRTEVERFYSVMQVCVNSATSGESLNMALREALSMGVPIIGSAVGGIPEIIQDGETGILFPPGDADALADAILKLIQDPVLRRSLADEGRRVVQSRFSLSAMLEKTEAYYDRLLTLCGSSQ